MCRLGSFNERLPAVQFRCLQTEITFLWLLILGSASVAQAAKKPSPPSDLAVTRVTSDEIDLMWRDNSRNELRFYLERSTNHFRDSVQFVLAANETRYADTNLMPSTAYAYRVRAWNRKGFSHYSKSRKAVTLPLWIPVFKGIDHATSSTALGVTPAQVVHVLRVDLLDPDVRFTSTPRSENYLPDIEETLGLTTSHFLIRNGVQAAINGNWFAPCCSDWDGLAEDIWGLAISSNVVVSAQDTETFSTSMLISPDNVPTMIGTNWPPANTDGAYTALSGKNPLLYQGRYVGTNVLVAPRTAIGHSQDKRYLFLLTIDGRQPGYSDGAADLDTAAWMSRFGASDAQNLDGGGSTTMAVSDGQGGAIVLNRPIHEGIPGLERVVANHLGIFAKPLPPSGIASVSSGLDSSISRATAAKTPRVVSDSRADLKLAPRGDGSCRITVRGLPDYTYRLQSTESLSAPDWQTLANDRANELGLFDYIDPRTAGTRFYRAIHP